MAVIVNTGGCLGVTVRHGPGVRADGRGGDGGTTHPRSAQVTAVHRYRYMCVLYMRR